MASWVRVRCPAQACTYSAMFRIARPSARSDDGGRADARLTLRDEHPDHDDDPAAQQPGTPSTLGTRGAADE